MDQQPQPSNNNQQYPVPEASQPQLTPTEPPKGKKTGLLIAIVVAVVVILGAVAFMALGSDKKDSNSTSSSSSSSSNENSASSNKFQKYDVADKTTGKNYSVSFYKDAVVIEKSGHTFLNSGESGSQYSVFIGTGQGSKIDCQSSPSTTMKINGQSTTVCYRSDNTVYSGYTTVKSDVIQVSVAGQKALSMDDAKSILESVTFK